MDLLRLLRLLRLVGLLRRRIGLLLGLLQLCLHRLQLLLHRVDLLLKLGVVGEGRRGNQEGRPEHRSVFSNTPTSLLFEVHFNPLTCTCKSALSLRAINPVPVYFSCVTMG